MRQGRGLLRLCWATCSVESHLFFCSPFSPAGFLVTAFGLSSSTATSLEGVACPVLGCLPRTGIDLLLCVFGLSWCSRSFPSIWRMSSVVPVHRMGGLSTLLLPFALSLLPSCVSGLFGCIVRSHLFFLGFGFILSPRRTGLVWIGFCGFLGPFRMGFAGPGQALR